VKRVSCLGVVLMVIALGAAACGGGNAAVSSGAKRAKRNVQPAATAAPSATVMVADSPLGKILVDANGHTLYEFDQETATSAACSAACATLWPALIVSGSPHGGTGIDAGKLGVLAIGAGSEVTYGGHPLHTFANDHAAGDVTGQGFGGVWWVLGADGQKITTPTSTPGTTVPATTPPQPARTSPPETVAPETAPATSPPPPQPTSPPKNEPPATTSPGTGGVAF
jgi:predicted lipoprotein with Yx(FWY)xxD motif